MGDTALLVTCMVVRFLQSEVHTPAHPAARHPSPEMVAHPINRTHGLLSISNTAWMHLAALSPRTHSHRSGKERASKEQRDLQRPW